MPLITTLDQFKKLKHGQKVTCKINGTEIKAAKISINECDELYICQNYEEGAGTDDMLGYKYGWFTRFDDINGDVKELKTLDKTLRGMEPGDILVDTDRNEYKVLEVFDNTFLLSRDYDFTLPDWLYTFEGADKDGFKLKEVEPKEDTQGNSPKAKVPVIKEIQDRLVRTNYDVSKSTLSNLKHICNSYLKSELEKMSKDELVEMIIKRKIVE